MANMTRFFQCYLTPFLIIFLVSCFGLSRQAYPFWFSRNLRYLTLEHTSHTHTALTSVVLSCAFAALKLVCINIHIQTYIRSWYISHPAYLFWCAALLFLFDSTAKHYCHKGPTRTCVHHIPCAIRTTKEGRTRARATARWFILASAAVKLNNSIPRNVQYIARAHTQFFSIVERRSSKKVHRESAAFSESVFQKIKPEKERKSVFPESRVYFCKCYNKPAHTHIYFHKIHTKAPNEGYFLRKNTVVKIQKHRSKISEP